MDANPGLSAAEPCLNATNRSKCGNTESAIPTGARNHAQPRSALLTRITVVRACSDPYLHHNSRVNRPRMSSRVLVTRVLATRVRAKVADKVLERHCKK